MKVIKSVKITSANNYGWIVDSSEAMKALDMWIEAVGEENALEDIARALSTDDLKENIEWVARQWGFGEELEDIEDAWDKYEYAKEVMGVSELLTNLSQAIGYDELSEDMAYIFRMNDFREWKSDYEDDEIESSRRITSSTNNDDVEKELDTLCGYAIDDMGGDKDAMFFGHKGNGFLLKGRYIDEVAKELPEGDADSIFQEVCNRVGVMGLTDKLKAVDYKYYQLELVPRTDGGNGLINSRKAVKSSRRPIESSRKITSAQEPLYWGDEHDQRGVNMYTREEYIEKYGEEPPEWKRVTETETNLWNSRRPIKSGTSIKEYAGFKIDDSVKINSPKRGPYKNGKTGIVVGFYKRYDGEILISVQLDEGGLMDFSKDELENLGDSGYHITYLDSSRKPIKSANGSWEYQGDDMDEVEEKIGDIGISFTEPLLLADDGTLYTRAGFDQWLKYLEREEGDNWSDAYELYHRDTDEEFIEMCQDDFFQHDFGYTLKIYPEGLKSIAESVAEKIPSNEAPFAIPSGFAFNLYAEEEEPSGFNSYWIDDMPLDSESFIWGINPKLGNRFDVAIDPDCLWNGTENIQSNKIQSKRLIKSGTSNFVSNDGGFPLCVYISEQYVYDEETDTQTEERDYDAEQWDYKDAIREAENLADEMGISLCKGSFRRSLNGGDDYSSPYNVGITDGYYEGIQIQIEDNGSFDPEYMAQDDYDYTHDDSFYDLSQEEQDRLTSETEEKLIKEQEDKINAYLEKLRSYGWIWLGVTARFSNGETMYHKV